MDRRQTGTGGRCAHGGVEKEAGIILGAVPRRVRQLSARPDAAAAATIDRRLTGGRCAHGGVEEEAVAGWLGLGCCVSR
jgi:hypothetical protein